MNFLSGTCYTTWETGVHKKGMNVSLEMQQKEENPKVDCFCDSLVTAVT